MAMQAVQNKLPIFLTHYFLLQKHYVNVWSRAAWEASSMVSEGNFPLAVGHSHDRDLSLVLRVGRPGSRGRFEAL